ncbi:hypothetical protein BBO_07639 [Beauveria brongniartii RCEF 3172]|uniref:Long chronological lifespan protein 2 n=1 Tax=Beauveria brongniartii RCEF 3172 TaxID=1081107 RepID=A0A166Z6P6_9HYPO|nr:hypothetical protein BBO_07639 [Beauveria brongniartii RCEF 3172]
MRLMIAFLSLLSLASAQFAFFDQMFGQQEQHHGQHHHQQQNNPSDASQYHARYEGSVCDKYLCPDSLACVHFPHHCPCIWDKHEEKFEIGEGKRLCISRGGFKDGEAARKVELARKGLL